MGLINVGQVHLPTEPPEFWHWSRGKMVYIHRHSLILRLDLVVGFLLGMVNATALNVFSTGRPW